MSRHAGVALEQLKRVFAEGTVAGMSEGELLARFLAQGDEAAFAALVARLGPMVLGTCRRILRDEHDAEDAFQATFLVLVRRASTIRNGDLLGPWLYKVACQIAFHARSLARLRHSREAVGAKEVAVDPWQSFGVEGDELRAVIHEVVNRLPQKYRAVFVLCHLQDQTREEASRRLGLPIGTVNRQMSKALVLMRTRLVRRGVALPAGVLAALAPAVTRAAVPPILLEATVTAATRAAAGGTVSAVSAAARVAALTREVMTAMLLTKFKVLGAATLVCLVTLGGSWIFAVQFGGSGRDEKPAENRQDSMSRAVDHIQADLAKSARLNAALQRQIQDLRAELESVRKSVPLTVAKNNDTAGSVPGSRSDGIEAKAERAKLEADIKGLRNAQTKAESELKDTRAEVGKLSTLVAELAASIPKVSEPILINISTNNSNKDLYNINYDGGKGGQYDIPGTFGRRVTHAEVQVTASMNEVHSGLHACFSEIYNTNRVRIRIHPSNGTPHTYGLRVVVHYLE